PRDSFLRKSRFGLVERGAGETEVETGLPHRSSLDTHPAKHFVFDLNQVPRIEEVALVEERIGHRLLARIERRPRERNRPAIQPRLSLTSSGSALAMKFPLAARAAVPARLTASSTTLSFST